MLVGRATGALHNAGPTWDERSSQGIRPHSLTLPKPLDVIQGTKAIVVTHRQTVVCLTSVSKYVLWSK